MSIQTTPWHKSSYSNEAGTCVEVSEGPVTGIRDNQNPNLEPLDFTPGAWARFLGGLHTG
ncbi:DUF397 domain-containing protein [Nocardiopsis dassonvillei]|uniref:DUF397 domain-containing protein n=1 Tax=Nocardiopsis dassonvillei (strain ATCC 23218 / DSM 43111 / CIP 107115 / JCM 7437 / KCTC 9190 / NBRC 14626 / NCTC 10488 / NRRL B-5397 / IMRU 509) TaxID=446468 RepID=D7AXZ9_NOCDD|nr:DUF397 domain-containing protein [Nocardiopsis dassonvillei]ADH69877.1 protein of unknown function DUF397 [Nocardiopsis dassonvillei subsp. dassonvillei DSM 43111]NKY78919.1 DUF397 domain-containing protein [Nocardiopsis dassonvillei]VEI90390.1 Domain of uncharacterised function (DUF397) [Nocardiopsis dassonvillei]